MDARLFIFDGDCAFCSSAARVFRRMIKDQVPIRPYQKLDLASLGLSEELTSRAVYYVRDGKYFVAAEAIAQLFIDSKTLWSVAGYLLRVPGINHLAERVYYWIAKNRHRLPGGTPECSM